MMSLLCVGDTSLSQHIAADVAVTLFVGGGVNVVQDVLDFAALINPSVGELGVAEYSFLGIRPAR